MSPVLLRRALTLMLSLVGAVAVAEEPVLRLCGDEWMPYNGQPDDDRPGYVIELARTIFEPQGVKVDYVIMPWEDALVAVREGRMSGAIGTNTTEAEGMVLSQEPIGSAPTCLMTLATSTWTYDNLASFRNARLGVIKDYSYWEALDAFIERQAGKNVTVVESDTPLEDLMTMLLAGEIEVLVESEPVLLWHLRSKALDRSQFRVVYKHASEPIFIGLAPTDEGRRFAAQLDEGLRSLRASGELDKLLRRYGLFDWR